MGFGLHSKPAQRTCIWSALTNLLTELYDVTNRDYAHTKQCNHHIWLRLVELESLLPLLNSINLESYLVDSVKQSAQQ